MSKTLPRQREQHDPSTFQEFKIYVVSGAFTSACRQLFSMGGFELTNNYTEADVIAFIGGTDINPALYGEKAIPATQYPDLTRDTTEKSLYEWAVENKKPMVGICRGAQFLHAMNGGKLWQHVNNHAGTDHFIIDLDTDEKVLSTSLHHQMLKPHPDLTIIAVAQDDISTVFMSEGTTINLSEETVESIIPEIEAGAYDKTMCVFTQGHPEIGSVEYRNWFYNIISDKFKDWNLLEDIG